MKSKWKNGGGIRQNQNFAANAPKRNRRNDVRAGRRLCRKASAGNARAAALSSEIVVLLCALQNLCPEKAAASQIERVIFDKKQTAENLFPYDFHGQISENTAFGAKSVPYFQLGKDILIKQMTLITALNSYSKISRIPSKNAAPTTRSKTKYVLLRPYRRCSFDHSTPITTTSTSILYSTSER